MQPKITPIFLDELGVPRRFALGSLLKTAAAAHTPALPTYYWAQRSETALASWEGWAKCAARVRFILRLRRRSVELFILNNFSVFKSSVVWPVSYCQCFVWIKFRQEFSWTHFLEIKVNWPALFFTSELIKIYKEKKDKWSLENLIQKFVTCHGLTNFLISVFDKKKVMKSIFCDSKKVSNQRLSFV